MKTEEEIKVIAVDKIKWADVRPPLEKPLEAFVAQKLPMYIMVRGPQYVVLCTRKVEQGVAPYREVIGESNHRGAGDRSRLDLERVALRSAVVDLVDGPAPALTKLWEGVGLANAEIETIGFDDSIRFLRVPDSHLAQLVTYGEATVSFFDAGGLEESPIEAAEGKRLCRSNIKRAGIVRQAMAGISGRLERPHHAEGLYGVSEAVLITPRDLYVIEHEFCSLLDRRSAHALSAGFPFEWGAEAMGVVWLYEAAYLHNHLKVLEEDEILDWLRRHAPKSLKKFCAWRGLEKWVPLHVDRERGRQKDRKVAPFSLEVVEEQAEDISSFKSGFVGDGLALILFLFDKWFDLIKMDASTSPATLGKWLVHHGFDDGEAVLLIQVATGKRCSDVLKDAVLREYQLVKPD